MNAIESVLEKMNIFTANAKSGILIPVLSKFLRELAYELTH